jgi:two-component system probable response regulator PhcQ
MTTAYDYKKFAVLYVDDEPQPLVLFKQIFESVFTVLTASSVDEALGLIETNANSIGVVITDQRMPQKTGVNLLNRLRESHPGIIRILTTAYSDLQSAIEAVNQGAIYKYVVKPWEIDDLRVLLMRALEFFIVQQERDLLFREKLSVIQRLILADRVKSLTVLAASLSYRLRNSMAALQQYLEQMPYAIQEELEGRLAKNPEYWTDLWGLAKHEAENALKMIQQVSDAVAEPHYAFTDEVELEEVIQEAAGRVENAGKNVAALDLVVDIGMDLPMFKVDRTLFGRMLTTLIARTAQFSQPNGRILIHATDRINVWNTPGLRILVAGEGPAWSEQRVARLFSAFGPPDEDDKGDLGLDLLSAFLVVFHHGGELSVKPQAPDGPGFEMRLPFSPTAANRPTIQQDLLEKLLLRFELGA